MNLSENLIELPISRFRQWGLAFEGRCDLLSETEPLGPGSRAQIAQGTDQLLARALGRAD
jgi:hypothetical protein